jgi:hypothetical protein
LRLRPFEAADALRVTQKLGDVIERLYPGGVEWLDRKLHTQARDPTSVRCTFWCRRAFFSAPWSRIATAGAETRSS